jgi:hypothetical protein
MARETTPHELAMVEAFTMERTKGGTGKSFAFSIKVYVNARGDVFLSDAAGAKQKEEYSAGGNETGPERVAGVLTLLCERAERLAKEATE